MELFIVIDTKGNGRVLGVFDSLAAAEQITNAYPSYYKLDRRVLNRINEEVLEWADDGPQRDALAALIAEHNG